MKTFAFLWIAMLGLFGMSQTASAQALDPENTLYLDTRYGRTVIQMMPHLAPNHVARIKKLTREKFYDGLKFHRVIEGFMAQTGDPTGTGAGESKYPDVRAEFGLTPFERGIVGMARFGNDRHSGNSQFFIMFARNTTLNGKYTAWGRVVSGMKYIDKIRRGVAGSGRVRNPDKIKTMRIAADAN